jgi:hypothetical protein
MPVVREIPLDKRPPAPIREIRVREIKENRPLARQKEASVMRPGAPMREMNVKVREGTPEVQAIRRPAQQGTGGRDLEKPRIGGPVGPEMRQARPERIPEKAGEVRPMEKSVGKPQTGQPVSRDTERSKDLRGAAKEFEKPRLQPQAEGRTEKPRPPQPTERVFEKQPPPRTPEKKIEKREEQRVQEKEIERPRPVEREKERGTESRQWERGMRGPEGRGR